MLSGRTSVYIDTVKSDGPTAETDAQNEAEVDNLDDPDEESMELSPSTSPRSVNKRKKDKNKANRTNLGKFIINYGKQKNVLQFLLISAHDQIQSKCIS